MLSICAIFRNESRYIREWIEFHRLVGVERFYLYNNNSTDDWQSQVQGEDVEVIDWPFPNPSQSAAYQHCINRTKGTDQWVAFIDIDEFLWSPRFATVSEAITAITSGPVGAIGVNWMCFGAGNETEYRPIPTIERFTWRPHESAPVDLHIKSIVNMRDPNPRCGSTPHHFDTEWGTITEQGVNFGGPFSPGHHSDILRINHYSSKSRPEWEARCALGKPDRADINPDPNWFNQVQPMEVQDFKIWAYLPELKARLNA